MDYPVVEIFSSFQGEGANVGLPAVFLRFGGCNLSCPWCDTEWKRFQLMPGEDVRARILALPESAVIVTGGEPLLQPDLPELLSPLKAAGRYLCLETNGTIPVEDELRELFNYIAVSPKPQESFAVQYAEEVRIVADGIADERFCRNVRSHISAQRYFISPCERQGRFAYGAAYKLLSGLNANLTANSAWRLSLQVHKLAGFR